MSALLEADRMSVGHGGGPPVVHDLTLEVNPGEVVALLGANGAGKTTTLLALAGELPVAAGEVRWRGDARRTPLHQRARSGMAFIGDDRSVLMELSVRDNLRIGRCDPDRALAHAPELAEFLGKRAGLLSGGQQQMLTIARALGRDPEVLLADELSLGLAPQIVDRLLGTIRRAADEGLGVLLVEQQVEKALAVADRVYVLRGGRMVYGGPAADARRAIDEIEAAYLGGDVPPREPTEHQETM